MPGSPHAVRRIAVSLLVLGACSAHGVSHLAAQSLTLEPGTRLRVTMEGARRSVVATVVETRRDTIVLGRASSRIPSTMPLATPQIRKLEVSIGQRSLAAAGAVAGAVTGLILAGSYNRVRAGQCFRHCPSNFPVLIGAGVGGVIGGVSLTFVRVDRWREITPPGRL